MIARVGFRAQLANHFFDLQPNPFEIIVNILIRYSDKSNSKRLNICLPSPIQPSSRDVAMDWTIHFDGEFQDWTVEIQNIRPNTMLSAKLDVMESLALQFAP